MAGKKVFLIKKPKTPYAQWFVELDLTKWLGTEKISNVDFSAKEISPDNDVDVSNVVLDQSKCTFDSYKVRPFIRAGEDGKNYAVRMQVTTDAEATREEFFIQFSVSEVYTQNIKIGEGEGDGKSRDNSKEGI